MLYIIFYDYYACMMRMSQIWLVKRLCQYLEAISICSNDEE